MDVDAAVGEDASVTVDPADRRGGSDDTFKAFGRDSSGHEQLLQWN
jgi:hypothetical protein